MTLRSHGGVNTRFYHLKLNPVPKARKTNDPDCISLPCQFRRRCNDKGVISVSIPASSPLPAREPTCCARDWQLNSGASGYPARNATPAAPVSQTPARNGPEPIWWRSSLSCEADDLRSAWWRCSSSLRYCWLKVRHAYSYLYSNQIMHWY